MAASHPTSSDLVQKLAANVKAGPQYRETKERIDELLAAEPELAVPAFRAAVTAGSGSGKHIVLQTIAARAKDPMIVDVIVEIGQTVPLQSCGMFADLIGGLDPDFSAQILEGLVETEHARQLCFTAAQERLVRYHDISEAGRTIHAQACAQGHPGAWLPAELHDHEVDLRMWLPFEGWMNELRPEPLLSAAPETAPQSMNLGQLLDSHGLKTSDGVDEAWGLAFEPAITDSNGRLELVAFGPEASAVASEIWQQILGRDAAVSPMKLGGPIEYFFSMARSPGAYTDWAPTWRARLTAGRSLAAWTGADRDASYLEVLDKVSELDWYRPDTSGDWFDHVAWDVSILAVNDKRGALLIGTDTD